MKQRFLLTFWFLLSCFIEIFRHSLAFVFTLVFGPFGILSETLFKDLKKIFDITLDIDEKVETKDINPKIDYVPTIELLIDRNITYKQIEQKVLKLKKSDAFNLYLTVKSKKSETAEMAHNATANLSHKLSPNWFKDIGCRSVTMRYDNNFKK